MIRNGWRDNKILQAAMLAYCAKVLTWTVSDFSDMSNWFVRDFATEQFCYHV